jgi:hypothetical protein
MMKGRRATATVAMGDFMVGRWERRLEIGYLRLGRALSGSLVNHWLADEIRLGG